jgi:uncharacterized protein (TIGR02594 family)
MNNESTPWLDIAFAEVGVVEVSGSQDNPRIQEYLKVCGLHTHDETPWCSAFVNWVLQTSGYEITGKANARSWLGYGGALSITPPLFRGAIAVFSRPGPDGKPSTVFGHVGFFMGQIGGSIMVLGGNQGNQVCIHPYVRDRLLGFRWPRPCQMPATAYQGTSAQSLYNYYTAGGRAPDMIKGYQAAMGGLTVDGVIGPVTKARTEKLLGKILTW